MKFLSRLREWNQEGKTANDNISIILLEKPKAKRVTSTAIGLQERGLSARHKWFLKSHRKQ